MVRGPWLFHPGLLPPWRRHQRLPDRQVVGLCGDWLKLMVLVDSHRHSLCNERANSSRAWARLPCNLDHDLEPFLLLSFLSVSDLIIILTYSVLRTVTAENSSSLFSFSLSQTTSLIIPLSS